MSIRLASQPSDRKWFDKHFGDGTSEEASMDELDAAPTEEMAAAAKADATALRKQKGCKLLRPEDLKPMEDKWIDYWAKRGLTRDANNLPKI